MPLGYLSQLVATMPALDRDDRAAGRAGPEPAERIRLQAAGHRHDGQAAARPTTSPWPRASRRCAGTTDAHLATPWKLLVGGRVVMEKPRYDVIADTFTHLAHHRGQLTVYLRLNGAPVPSIYGPSADDRRF